MQKVVSVTLVPNQMSPNENGYVYTDYEELNKLLEDGYRVQTHFMSNPTGNSTWPTITFILIK